ncbi:MAG TPA: hypothetical protein VF324_05140 [Methanobacterium sp.]|jgi:hypothetical protein
MVAKTELKQKVIGIGFEDDLIVRSQRGKVYSVKLTEGLEIDSDNLIGKESDETVWATIDTDSDPWVIIDVEIEKDA